MTKYALIDFDGYICKAFYAHKSRSGQVSNDDAEYILNNLVCVSIKKAQDFFSGEEITIILFISRHSWKKTTYRTYKENREHSPELGEFRDRVLEQYSTIGIDGLEADDLIAMCASFLDASDRQNDYIIFSDDKDLKNVAHTFCKINLTENIQGNSDNDYRMLLCQMIAGDKEDDVTGIPRIGMKTADKLLPKECNINDVIKLYHDKNIDIFEAKKNINLILPLVFRYNDNQLEFAYLASEILDKVYLFSEIKNSDMINKVIAGQLLFIDKRSDEVYGK